MKYVLNQREVTKAIADYLSNLLDKRPLPVEVSYRIGNHEQTVSEVISAIIEVKEKDKSC